VTPQERLAETVRAEGARVLATLARTLGSLELAEDAVQDAAVAALRTWPRSGVPDDPRAWLAVAARNKAYDMLRRETARRGKETAAGWYPPTAAGRADARRAGGAVAAGAAAVHCCTPAGANR
jgi:predicted RNA polymerase sigma factor